MTIDSLKILIENLVKQIENEIVEFKTNFHSAEEIGERISAISNSCCLLGQEYGYIVFGVSDDRKIVGTSFHPKSHKAKGNEDLELWLINRLSPRIDFQIYEFEYHDKNLAIFIIPATKSQPVSFLHQAYVRVGSYTKKLSEYPEKQAKIWRSNSAPYELNIAKENLSVSEVINLLNVSVYFDLMKIPFPSDNNGIMDKLEEEEIVIKRHSEYAITNLGALLFAKHLKDFPAIQRKNIRVIVYKGQSKVETIRERYSEKGYAIEFEEILNWIYGQLPANEEIGRALRKETRMYPEIAIRELFGNFIIHQDLSVKGFPIIEIFSDRIEFSNPGIPIVNPDRFIDSYKSRNDNLADIMRRMRFCEERGSGMDKVFFYNELYQLPPISVVVSEEKTKITLFAYKRLNDLDKKEKIMACYQHACLKYVSNDKMTNQSLRERFQIDDQNAAIASRIIKDTLSEKMIKLDDPENTSRKFMKYIPFWA